MDRPVRLMLVEDHLAYRQSFRIALGTMTQFVIAGEASGAREAVPLIEQIQPDLVIMDFFLSDSDGVSLVRELKRRRSRTPVLMLANLSHPLFVRDALTAGVRGYALKREPLGALIGAIERVSRGERYLSPELESALTESPDDEGLERLSRREREVLCLLVDGRSSKEIAAALCVSPRTVDAHRLQINHKLALRSPSQLARYFADAGFMGMPKESFTSGSPPLHPGGPPDDAAASGRSTP